ncbi:MAG: NAD(P)/FAD-dependent oxidoreductase [Candidatus Babeliales bacterium]
MQKKYAIIIGAGPAGLTAAYELLKKTDIIPIVLEKSEYMGGLSRTINYKGNRIDIGGHRFFSKSDRVMQWWQTILPLQELINNNIEISYQNKKQKITENHKGPNPDQAENVMLVRQRKSRIFFNRTFFDYPLKINTDTVKKMGFLNTIKIGGSYLYRSLFPIKNEKNLEEFFINRFGSRLYRTFFKSYTEKVWGIPCNQISAEWGAQRIKGLSIAKAVKHFGKQFLPAHKTDIAQKDIETSLIQQFLYPKYGPGQMWEEVAKQIKDLGGIIYTHMNVKKLFVHHNIISKVEAINTKTNETQTFNVDYAFSTMPIKELICSLKTDIPEKIKKISDGLMYRDFITIGILANKLKAHHNHLTDNWIYVQEQDVHVGRIQIFNNWSPYMIADPSKIWIGLEYFCYETDELWQKTEKELIELAKHELHILGIVDKVDVLDATVIKVEKTYPAYFGTYDQFDVLKDYLDTFENLFLIGRNGMHKYNNQDHSMLTAMTAVENIIAGKKDKTNIWAVNTEQEYHETKN